MEFYLKQYEEWKKSRQQKQALTEHNQVKKSATEALKQVKSGGIIKRQNTFSSARRSPRLKENLTRVPAIKRSHSLTVKPAHKAYDTFKSKVLSQTGRISQNASSANAPTTEKTPHHPVTENAVSRKELLEEWKRKKEEERQKQLQARLQSVHTPHKGHQREINKTPGPKDNRPPFIVENLANSKTKFESARKAGLLNERRQTLGEDRKVTLTSGLERRKSYAEQLKASGKKTGNVVKRSQSVISKPKGPCQSLIQRKKEESHRITSHGIHRSNSCAGPSSSAAAALQRRKSYGQVLRAAVEHKAAHAPQKGKRTSLSTLHRMGKTQTQNVKPKVSQDANIVEEMPQVSQPRSCVDESMEHSEMVEDAAPETSIHEDANETQETSRRSTFSPKEIQTAVEELKASTGPGRRSTPQQDTPKSKPTFRSRKSILKSEQMPKTPGRKVQFNTPSSVTLRRSKPATPSWTPKKEQSMREKLDAWLISKGRTPTRFRHLHCFDEHLNCKGDGKIGKKVDAGLTSDELRHQQEMLDVEEVNPPVLNVQLQEVIGECQELVEMGCPGDTLLGYLDKIEEYLPSSKQSSAYWICRARVAEEEDQEEVAVDMYESAVVHGAQPPRDIVEALKGFVTRMEDRKRAKREASITPWKPHKEPGMDENNIFESSSVKYCVSKSTPLMKRLDSTGRKQKGTPKAVITPVRRSTRLSHSSLPSILQDHDEIVDDLDSLPAESQASALFKPNRALEQDFDEVMDEQD